MAQDNEVPSERMKNSCECDERKKEKCGKLKGKKWQASRMRPQKL